MVGEKLIFKIMVSRLLANAFASQKNESRRFNLCNHPPEGITFISSHCHSSPAEGN